MQADLISPYGGKLVNLLVAGDEKVSLLEKASQLPSIQISPRSVSDLVLLATGAFSPLNQFMNKQDYLSVLENMQLTDGTFFPLPITLPLDDPSDFKLDEEIVLRNPRNEILAVMRIEEIYEWSLEEEARAIYGTTDSHHPLISEMVSWGKYYIAGPLKVVNLPPCYDFPDLRKTPAQVRKCLGKMGVKNVVSFQSSELMHRREEELTKRITQSINGALLIHPLISTESSANIDYYTRIRCYRAMVENYFDPNYTILNLLSLAMRFAGERELLWSVIVNRNYGANHFIVGKEYANFHSVLKKIKDQIGVKAIPFEELAYLPEEDRYEKITLIPPNKNYFRISEQEIKEEYLAQGKSLPFWFTRPEVAEILEENNLPRHKQGFCVWFTGLPCAGKSTIAEILSVMLMARGKKASILDGDVIRTHLSRGLGFSKEDRFANVLRVGFVASQIVKHNGVVLCALVSPYRAVRSQVRNMIGSDNFIEVFVDTPVSVCEERDCKGLYTKARRGEIKNFTGIDDPYEAPLEPEVHIQTVNSTPEECAVQILEFLYQKGFLLQPTEARIQSY